ncbi:tryptophan 2,3-dioxygenase family protein [Streptomyces sp. NPDC048297]|uniref:tryptophan 2,3-dioxygenase family protein n=1 Tax=Streptomyces sp. NPDC048297 TaxID=3365531 RepID=UPI0037131126
MLPKLLSLQQPRSCGQGEAVRDSEHFFIVVHQSAELLLGQVVGDLIAVARAGERNPCDWAEVESRLTRAVGIAGLLQRHIEVLEHLPREHFHAFRAQLGTATGGQSEQFARIFAMLGRGEPTGSSEPGRDSGGMLEGPGGPPPAGVTEGLAALRQAMRRWQVAHIALAERMLGDAPGTGGTAGSAWLRSRLLPVPDPGSRAWSTRRACPAHIGGADPA